MDKYKGREQRLYDELTIKYLGSMRGVVGNKRLAPRQCRICLQMGHMGNECSNRVPGFRARAMPKMEVDTTEPPPEPPYSGSVFGRLLSMDLTQNDDEEMPQAPPVDTSASASADIPEAITTKQLSNNSAGSTALTTKQLSNNTAGSTALTWLDPNGFEASGTKEGELESPLKENEEQGPSAAEDFLEKDTIDPSLEEAIHNNNHGELESLNEHSELESQNAVETNPQEEASSSSSRKEEKIKKILWVRPGPKAMQQRNVKICCLPPKRAPKLDHLIRNAQWNKGERF